MENEVQISRNYGFEAAHYIPNHKGLCKQLHGHSYTGKVTIAGISLDEMGMIMDYGDLKVIIQDVIENKFDHAMLNDTFNTPTAEVMVLDFFKEMKAKLSADHPKVRLVEVTLKETADSEATVRA
jgi:6-pyruvoyltetrahydropterin/6-carboxytetrahydropterin synthase